MFTILYVGFIVLVMFLIWNCCNSVGSSTMIMKNVSIPKGARITMESNGGTMIVENCEVRADIEQSNTRSWLGKNVQKITGCTVNAPVKQITTLRWKSHQQIIENQEINQPVIQRNGGYVCEN